jgi:predicted RNA-binding Zn ribbon-like protein
MRKPETKPLRVRSVSTKLTEAEYVQCERMAARCGLAVSEWCRQAVLEASDAGAVRAEDEVILAEILALRKIVINLVYGREAGEALTKEQVRELIESADADKISKAANRLQAALQARLGGSPNGKHHHPAANVSGNIAPAAGLAE